MPSTRRCTYGQGWSLRQRIAPEGPRSRRPAVPARRRDDPAQRRSCAFFRKKTLAARGTAGPASASAEAGRTAVGSAQWGQRSTLVSGSELCDHALVVGTGSFFGFFADTCERFRTVRSCQHDRPSTCICRCSPTLVSDFELCDHAPPSAMQLLLRVTADGCERFRAVRSYA